MSLRKLRHLMGVKFEQLESSALAMAAVTLIALSAHGLGGAFLRIFSPAVGRPRSSTTLKMVVGLQLLGLFGLLIGLGQFRTEPLRWILLTTGIALTFLDFRGLETFLKDTRKGLARLGRGSMESVVFTLIALFTLGPALCFPDGWDELVYHQVLPLRWNADGGCRIYPDLPYSGFPSLAELLFWILSPMESRIAPRLLMWLCWILSLGQCYRLFLRRMGRTASSVLLIGMALSSTMMLISQSCYVEPLQLLILATILNSIRFPRRTIPMIANVPSAILLGILSGAIASTKLTGVSISMLVVLWSLVDIVRTRWGAAAIIRSTIVIGFSVLAAFPMYLRPWMLTGNPCYPYFDDWFSLASPRLLMSQFHHEVGSNFGFRSLVGFLTAPLLQGFLEDIYDGGYGIQLIVVLAVGVRCAFRNGIRRGTICSWFILLNGLILYLIWFLTAQQARFAFASVLFAYVGLSVSFARLRPDKRKLLLGLILGCTLISFPYPMMGYYGATWAVVLQGASVRPYLQEGTRKDYMELVEYVGQLPENTKLITLYEHRTLYMRYPCTIVTPFFQEGPLTPPKDFQSERAFLEVFEREKATHLIVAKSPRGPDNLPEWYEQSAPLFTTIENCTRSKDLALAWESEHYWVFKREPDGSAITESLHVP